MSVDTTLEERIITLERGLKEAYRQIECLENELYTAQQDILALESKYYE